MSGEDDDSTLKDLNQELINLVKITLQIQKYFDVPSSNVVKIENDAEASNKAEMIKQLQDLVVKMETDDFQKQRKNSHVHFNFTPSTLNLAPTTPLPPSTSKFVTVSTNLPPLLQNISSNVSKLEKESSNLSKLENGSSNLSKSKKFFHSKPLKSYTNRKPLSSITWLKNVSSRNRKMNNNGQRLKKSPEKIEISNLHREERIPCPICGDPKFFRYMNHHMKVRHGKNHDRRDVNSPSTSTDVTQLQGPIAVAIYPNRLQKQQLPPPSSPAITVKDLIYGALRDITGNHTAKTCISCSWCQQIVKKDDLEEHMRMFHEGQSYMSSSSVKIPWKLRFVRCKLCREIFRYPAYNQHMRRVHHSIGCRYKCSVCFFGFQSERACKIHMHRMKHRSNIIVKNEPLSDDYERQAQNQSIVELN